MKVRLGDVATYINGYAFKPEDWSDSGLPIIRIQDLTGNSYKTNRFSGKYDKKFEVNDGDILISWSASIGVYIWRGEKAVLNQHIFKVKFDKQVNICKKFFIYQVENILKKAILETHGATMKHLTKPVFDSLPFYLPDIKKQNEISAILDKISEIISLRQQQLKKLDELVKSRFIEMFGDPLNNKNKFPMTTMGNEFKISSGGTPSTEKEEYWNNGTIPWIGSNMCQDIILYNNDGKFITEKGYKNSSAKLFFKGTVLVALVGATVGKTALLKFNTTTNQNIAGIDVNGNNKFNSEYIFYHLQFQYSKFMEIGDKKFKMANLKFIRELGLLAAPITLQNQFADFVKQTDKSKLEIQKSLDKLEILKKSLMQQYFG